MHGVINSTSPSKKPLSPPRRPVKDETPFKQKARRTANITSIFHEDDLRNSAQGVRAPIPKVTDTKSFTLQFTQPDAAGDKDLMAGNRRPAGRNQPNPLPNPNPCNVAPPNPNARRNPPRRVRQVQGRGQPPQPAGPRL